MPGFDWRTLLRRAWQRRGPLAWLLWPVSLLYGTLVRRHLATYRNGHRHPVRLPVPVVVVGNVVAGGVGKTPLVIALVRHCQQQQVSVGVVSRGYGRRDPSVRAVTADSDSRQVGDEPLLIACVTGAPVWVGADRVAAAQALLQHHPDVQLILSDDGLQHLALARDLELCVFDERGIGNGWLLPAGPLRESWPRPPQAGVVCHEVCTSGLVRPGQFSVTRRLARHARQANGNQRLLQHWQGRPVRALAGIARPERFFEALRAEGLDLQHCIALPDHADLHTLDIDILDGDLVCTEKDAVKLWPRHPQVWAVPLELELSPALRQMFDAWLFARLTRRL